MFSAVFSGCVKHGCLLGGSQGMLWIKDPRCFSCYFFLFLQIHQTLQYLMILFVLMYVKFCSVFKGGLIQNWNAFIQLQPQLEAADITIVAILLSLARVFGLKKMFAVIVHVKTTFSYSNLHWLGIKHEVTYLLTVIVMTWQSALLKSPVSGCSCRNGR